MQNIIKNIIEAAIYAPSGDNSQPWYFKIENDNLLIFNNPKKDNPIFNFNQWGSYIAHGTLLENISIISPTKGLTPRIQIFPDDSNQDLIAQVTFIPCTPEPNILYPFIKLRCTNRKKYNSAFISAKQKNDLLNISHTFHEAQASYLDDPAKKMDVGIAASTAERTMLGYKPLHEAFFNMIRWNEEQEEKMHGGLNIETMELNAPQKFIFKLFSYWKIAKLLNALGMAKIVSTENSKTYGTSALIGCITVPNKTSVSFINTGILLQKIWLITTLNGLSLQPIAGTLYLAQRLQEGKLLGISPSQATLIKESEEIIYKHFNSSNKIITMLFRIGKAIDPSARSAKFPPIIEK